MKRKTGLVILPLTVAVTAAATVGILRIPWRSIIQLPVSLGLLLIDRPSPPPAATKEAAPAAPQRGEPDTPPAAVEQAAGPEPIILAATVSVPDEAAAPEPAAAPPASAPVDYARLQDNLKLVTDALERFNQKLLRIIAQARAEQQRQEAEPLTEAGTTVALDDDGVTP